MLRLTRVTIDFVTEPEPIAETVLANLEWMIRNRNARVSLEHGMVFVGDGGFDLECLADPDCTPAGRRLAANDSRAEEAA
jgi:hypothetical protein